MKIKDTRHAGLVEIEIDTGGLVVLTLHPPGARPAQVLMHPDQARSLAGGLLEASEQIEAGHAGQS